jgi:hypothetical protein
MILLENLALPDASTDRLPLYTRELGRLYDEIAPYPDESQLWTAARASPKVQVTSAPT